MSEKKSSSSAPESETIPEATPFNVDRPKQHLVEDQLGYSDFARAVARSIAGMTSTDGVVMAIHGPWGSGKTSAVNMIVEALSQLLERGEKKDRVITVRFNPWWFSEQRDLTLSFFAELSAGLGDKVSGAVKSALLGLAKRVMGSKDVLMSAMALAPGGEALKLLLAEAFGFLGEKGGAESSVEQVRKDLEAALVEEGKRVLVIIDDVDRLPADEARQIFRLVKSVADLPNVTYLLVFDRAIVEQALEPLAADGGARWLEKIVQVSVDLPPVHPLDLRKMFFAAAETVLDDVDLGNDTHWGNVFLDVIAPRLRTPRDVIRLVNAIALAWPAVKGEVNVPDFLAIETLRLFEHALYTVIRSDFEHIISSTDALLNTRPQRIADAALRLFDEAEREPIKASLERIFPQTKSIWSTTSYTSHYQAEWDRKRRICSPRHFRTYFKFGVNDNAISHIDLENFLENIENKKFVIDRIKQYADQKRSSGGTKAAVLLNELEVHLSGIPETRVEAAAKNLIFAGDDFLRKEDERHGGLGMPVIWAVAFLVNDLLRRLPQEARFDVLNACAESSPSLATISFLVSMARDEHGRPTPDGPKPKPPEERLLEDVPLRTLESTLARRLASAAQQGALLGHPHAAMLIADWCDRAGEVEVKSWIDKHFEKDDFIIALTGIFTGIGHVYTSDDQIGKKYAQISREQIERLIGLERFINRVTTIDERPDLTPAEKKAVTNFLEGTKARH